MDRQWITIVAIDANGAIIAVGAIILIVCFSDFLMEFNGAIGAI